MSMAVGSPSKWDVARRIVAGIGYLSLAHFDEVHVSVFSNTLTNPFRIRRAAQVEALLAYLNGLKLSEGRGSFARAVESVLESV